MPTFVWSKVGGKPNVQRSKVMAALGKISLRENFLDSSRGKMQIRVSGRAVSATTSPATRDLSKIGGVPANVSGTYSPSARRKGKTRQ